jgi:hypothetical protein
MFSDYIVRFAIKDFTNIIATYDNVIRRTLITRLDDRQIHRDICTTMLKAVLLPCMHRCNIGTTDSKFVQEILVQLLYCVPNINRLILPSEERLYYMQLLVERVQILTRLREFRFHISCTREIIIKLSKYCPYLNKLSVQDSIRVDDVCVEHILNMAHLHSLNVSNTSVSPSGYTTLLAGLPNVRGVIWSGPVDLVLTDLSGSLPSVRKFDGTISAAGLLVQKCPNIKQLFLHFLTNDMSDLGELRKVTYLSIRNCSCTVIRLSDALIRLDSKLSTLEMHEVENVNVNDLINYCTVLNELRISCCSITFTEIFRHTSPHFRNLKKLRLRNNRGASSFYSALHLYENLKIFHVVGTRQINDELINQIMAAGGFRNLTEFVVDHCGQLSMDTTSSIMNNCPNLIKLGNLDSWPGVPNEEISTFSNFVRNNNLSLTVFR